MAKTFETTMSSKGQVVIAKEIREELGLRPNQKFAERMVGNEVVLRPVLPLSKAGGVLKGIENKPTRLIIDEVKRGWR